MSVHQLVPLPVVVPLLTAAAIALTSGAPRRVHDAMATAAAAGTAVLCAVLLGHAQAGPIVEWLGGWRPHHGVATGIALTGDQFGAGGALLAAVLVTGALVYSWVYFEELDGLVHALMLVMCAGMVGFCLTGDLFTMVVFFVLTTVPAIGLTAIATEHRGPLQGALNFGVVNSVAGFALLFGAALVYGRTGALNLAQIAKSFDGHPADALVAVALALLVFGMLTKAGVAPFHFWLPDAHAVAPTPVSTLFSGAMVTTALLGSARLLSTAFAHPVAPHAEALRAVLVGAGAVTAVVAAIACFEQRHVKRLLAFGTASQVGTMLCGIGLMRDTALAGAALTAIGFGLAIAALFGAAGVLLRRFDSTDELELRGRAGDMPATGILLAAGALVIATVPPSAGFRGQALIADGARAIGYDWLPPLLATTAGIVAAAILRMTARIFLGWGPDRESDPSVASEERSQASRPAEEEPGSRGRPPLVLLLVPAMLIIVAFVAGALPGFSDSVSAAGAHFRDTDSYIAAVLSGAAPRYASVATPGLGASAWLLPVLSLVVALVAAAVALRGRRVFPGFVVDPLRAAHSGHVGDYVAWWTFGMTVLGGCVLWAVAG